MRWTFLLVLLLLPSGPLAGQVGLQPSEGRRVSSAGAVQLKGSRVAHEERLHAGGWAGLVFGDRLAVGGAGFALLRDVELLGPEAGIGFDLGMGYGGLFVAYWGELSARVTGQLGFLAGAGHAELTDRLIGREVGSDNFPVLEPDLSLFFTIHPGVRIGASIGYRMVWSVDNLATVSAKDLRATTGTLSLRVGGK